MDAALLQAIQKGKGLKKVPDSQKNDRSSALAGKVAGSSGGGGGAGRAGGMNARPAPAMAQPANPMMAQIMARARGPTPGRTPGAPVPPGPPRRAGPNVTSAPRPPAPPRMPGPGPVSAVPRPPAPPGVRGPGPISSVPRPPAPPRMPGPGPVSAVPRPPAPPRVGDLSPGLISSVPRPPVPRPPAHTTVYETQGPAAPVIPAPRPPNPVQEASNKPPIPSKGGRGRRKKAPPIPTSNQPNTNTTPSHPINTDWSNFETVFRFRPTYELPTPLQWDNQPKTACSAMYAKLAQQRR